MDICNNYFQVRNNYIQDSEISTFCENVSVKAKSGYRVDSGLGLLQIQDKIHRVDSFQGIYIHTWRYMIDTSRDLTVFFFSYCGKLMPTSIRSEVHKCLFYPLNISNDI